MFFGVHILTFHSATAAMLCPNRMGLYSGSERKKKKKIVINTPFKYKTNKNKNKHDIHFAYQRTIQ